MIKKNLKQQKAEKVDIAKNTDVRWMLGPNDNMPNFYFRVFDIKKGGNTPFHEHDWEHEVFVLEGKGYIKYEGKEIELKPYDTVYVPPGKKHQFINKEDSLLRFICVIPKTE